MASKSREARAIATVACPVCRAAKGDPCDYNPDERRKLGARLKSLPIHGARRKLYQDVRDAEAAPVIGWKVFDPAPKRIGLMLRLPPDIHEAIVRSARESRRSLNEEIVEACSRYTKKLR